MLYCIGKDIEYRKTFCVALVWGLLSQFPQFRYVPIFLKFIKIVVIYGIPRTHLADVACRRSLAAVTSVKYRCDLKNLT